MWYLYNCLVSGHLSGHLIDQVMRLTADHLFIYAHNDHNVNSYSASHDNWCTGTLLNIMITVQWEGMGDVGSARYEPALLPLCPTIRVLSNSTG